MLTTDRAKPAYAPNSDKQAAFLAASAFEVLYGGRVGGGKTFGLVGDAMGMSGTWTDDQGAVRASVEHPRYEGIIFRKYAEDLDEIRRLCTEIFQACWPGTKFKRSADVFVFPSGATIELGGLPKANSEERYKSRSFQWIGWEELTEHESPDAYVYLVTRCRPGNGMPNDFPCYIRATTNPDGPGQAWVKARFHIEDEGHSVSPFVGHRETINGKEYIFHRQFIAAGIEDNPDLPDSYLAQMGGLSDEKRRALVYGRWDVVSIPGAIFKKQFIRISEEKRIREVPYVEGYPVNTFWDLGVGDTQAIWFHQRVGNQDRFIDFYQNSSQALAHYVELVKSRKYLLGTHYLPHDAKQRVQGEFEIRTVQEMLEDLGLYPTIIVPRVSSVDRGIELARQALSAVVFDKAKCKEGTEALKAYRFKYDPKKNTLDRLPLHDWASHPADAFRQFAQGFYEGGHQRVGEVETEDPLTTPLGKVAKRKFRADVDDITNPSDTRWAEV